jgi:hypothetical protein
MASPVDNALPRSVADPAASVTRAADDGRTTLFVLPSLGVAERVTQILAEYQVESRLS